MSLGVGIVGHGSAGRQHVAALRGVDGARVVAVLEEDPAAGTGGLPRAASWPALLADPEVGLVALCVPPGGRARLAVEALEAGKAVLLEKPPTTSAEEHAEVLAAARAAGRPVGVMLQHRLRLPEPALATDWTGPEVTAVLEVSRYRPPDHYRRAGWRGDPTASFGGIAAHLGVHYLDLACQLLGRPATVALAPVRERAPGIDSRVAGTVVFESGATLAFAVTAESPARTERLHLLGPGGALLVADGQVTTTTAEGVATSWPAAPTAALRGEVYREMVHAVATGLPPRRCHLEGARGVTDILAGVVRGTAVTR
ncbi:Gfo/Idh/MocA family protein [Streptomyces albidoflavus]